jgi:hypothetical protein
MIRSIGQEAKLDREVMDGAQCGLNPKLLTVQQSQATPIV